jgi:hypothetical protein
MALLSSPHTIVSHQIPQYHIFPSNQTPFTNVQNDLHLLLIKLHTHQLQAHVIAHANSTTTRLGLV